MVIVGLHVDDVSQTVIEQTPEKAISKATLIGSEMVERAQAKGCELSDKSTVVASTPHIARQVAKQFWQTKHQDHISKNDGRPRGADGSRCQTTHHNNKETNQERSSKSSEGETTSGENRRASKLYNTWGETPTAVLAWNVKGQSPTTRRQLRRSALQCIPAQGMQPCPVTRLFWYLGPEGDPEVSTTVAQIKLWMDIWGSASSNERQLIDRAWRAIARRQEQAKSNERWRTVTGPIGATITMLLELGWHPILPHMWLNPTKTEAAQLSEAKEGGAVQQILAAIAEQAQRRT